MCKKSPDLVLTKDWPYLPLSQEQQEEPSPKKHKRECAKSEKLKLEFDIKYHVLFYQSFCIIFLSWNLFEHKN